MIELKNGYYAVCDSRGYTLKRDTGKYDKQGDRVFKTAPCGHHTTLQSCIKQCVQLLVKERLEGSIRPLDEAVRLINESQQEFEELLKKAIKE